MARQETVQHNSSGALRDSVSLSVLEGAGADLGNGIQNPSPRAEALVNLSDEGHLELVLPAGEVITGSMAVAAAEKIDELAAEHSLPLLLTLTGVESISRSARDVFSAARSLAAVAVIGVSPVDRVIANFLLGGEVQPCPTRYFSQEGDALNWLRRYDT
ncbi:STAS/SEC14 domain-containing protein [Arthrobacter sp. zg-Y826]|uniref:DUF7793 family protein n=1 Tax=Arthrobacter jinronghuae TaxID=2964609 RepID=UPI0021068727|nr:STAS/SEC14 domain-containing protein [Arthrobacter jinronghuae]MCQ1957293.1 STAS/SEC14 domain-containing protein [Arthrobacter jinronghuae]